MLRDRGAVAALGVSIQNDEIPLRRVAPQEDAPIRDLNFLPVRFLKIKKIAGGLDNEWIDFGRFDFYIWIIILEGALGAAAAQADHRHAGKLRVPKPGHMKVFRVLEMTLQWVGHRHP